MAQIVDLDSIEFVNGFWPTSKFDDLKNPRGIIRAGGNLWPRADARQEIVKGLLQVSNQALGPRIFVADTQRAAMAGTLIAGRLPYAGLVRYANSAFFFLGEQANQQVYLDEAALAGVTTSGTPFTLRVAYQVGGVWTCLDAGMQPANLPAGNVTVIAGGTKGMNGSISVRIVELDTRTDTPSNPSEAVEVDVGTGTQRIRVTVPPAVNARRNALIIGATRWKAGKTGPWNRARPPIRLTVRGTFTLANGSANVTAGVGTVFKQDAKPGDVWTMDGVDYTLATVDSNSTATLTANYAGVSGAGKTATVKSFVLDYYNEELKRPLDFSNHPPPKALGVINFNNRLLVFGCPGPDGTMPGSIIQASNARNPEGFPVDDESTFIQTTFNDAIVNVEVGDGKIYAMATNGLDVVTFTNDPDVPFLTRRVLSPGFLSQRNGCAAAGQFFGFVGGKAVRVDEQDRVDVEFGKAVEDLMRDWDARRTVLVLDPKNSAVLYVNYDGVGTTKVVPWMLHLGQWGTPQTYVFPSIAVMSDGCTVGDKAYLTIDLGGAGAYRAYQFDGGDGNGISGFAATEFLYGQAQTARKSLREILFTGRANELRVYLAKPGLPVPNVDGAVPPVADATFNLSDTEVHEQVLTMNLEPCRSYTVRVDLTGPGRYVSQIVTRGEYLGGVQ